MIGIFRLECIETENNYLKRSFTVKEDLEETIVMLNEGKHENKTLQKEWNEYGEEGFEIGIPETMEFDDASTEQEKQEVMQEAIEEWMDVLESVEEL